MELIDALDQRSNSSPETMPVKARTGTLSDICPRAAYDKDGRADKTTTNVRNLNFQKSIKKQTSTNQQSNQMVLQHLHEWGTCTVPFTY